MATDLPPSFSAPDDADCVVKACGLLVVVGGHSRNVGKTTVIERLLAKHREEPWVAIKISAHRHASEWTAAPAIEEHFDADLETQTGRYLLAGAHRAFLVRAPDAAMPHVAAFIESLLSNGWNVIAESNRIVTELVPDFVVFVIDPRNTDWKPSSDVCLAVADVAVFRDHRFCLEGSSEDALEPIQSDHRARVLDFVEYRSRFAAAHAR